jgi:hypothetical protein
LRSCAAHDADGFAAASRLNKVVMVGFRPTIHAFFLGAASHCGQRKSWMVATSATMTIE